MQSNSIQSISLKPFYGKWGAGYNMYKNIQYIYMTHVDCDIDYGGQAFSYI